MLHREQFGKMPDSREVSRYFLTNASGMEVVVTNYAAAITSLKVPDRLGKLADVVLGFDSLDGYLNDKVFMGAVVGRYANRIANARFVLDGNEYRLSANNGANTLHGGAKGFFKNLWELKASRGNSIALSYSSPDGEEGFPGNLVAEITYTLTDSNELKLVYRATTDKPTVICLTGHAYFNLAGEGNASILDHELKIDADAYVPTDSSSIPTGEIVPVKGTPFDFTSPTTIGDQIESDDEQMKYGQGYDVCWVLRNSPAGESTRAAFVRDPNSGRALEIWTTEPGIQFYSGNFLNGSFEGKGGYRYPRRSGFCLETQHYPDSPNQPHFPSTVLRPGEEYRSTTVYKFSAS